MNDFLIIVGLVLAGFSLRSFAFAAVRRLGSLVILAASFQIGLSLFGNVWAGVLCVLLWFVIPMIQVLRAARGLSLPLEKRFRPKNPPSSEDFPELAELTAEFEAAGFEQADDIGWDWLEMKQFVRLMIHEEQNLQGSIHLNVQGEIFISYAMLVTRLNDGTQWTTWNYPYGMSMKLPPECKLNRAITSESLEDLMAEHARFLSENGIVAGNIAKPDPEQLLHLTDTETRRQIDHNLDEGLLRLCGEGKFAYSWRGCFFMMRQFMIDMLRLS